MQSHLTEKCTCISGKPSIQHSPLTPQQYHIMLWLLWLRLHIYNWTVRMFSNSLWATYEVNIWSCPTLSGFRHKGRQEHGYISSEISNSVSIGHFPHTYLIHTHMWVCHKALQRKWCMLNRNHALWRPVSHKADWWWIWNKDQNICKNITFKYKRDSHTSKSEWPPSISVKYFHYSLQLEWKSVILRCGTAPSSCSRESKHKSASTFRLPAVTTAYAELFRKTCSCHYIIVTMT